MLLLSIKWCYIPRPASIESASHKINFRNSNYPVNRDREAEAAVHALKFVDP